MTIRAEHHRFVRHADVWAWLACGWMALPSLEGTGHGLYSFHIAWLCSCEPVEPKGEGVT